MKRIEGQENKLLFDNNNLLQNLLIELGIPQQRNEIVHILFCRDTFNHDGLLNNDLNCDHLGKYIFFFILLWILFFVA